MSFARQDLAHQGRSTQDLRARRPAIRRPQTADRLLPEFRSLAVGDLIADGPDYRSYWRVLAAEPQRAIVYHSIRHPWRPHPFDPNDRGAVGRVEAEIIAGGVYLDCTWTFVLQPVGAERTRLLIRTRGTYAPRLLGLVMPALGLYDASYGMAQLRAIARRAEALATTPPTAATRSPQRQAAGLQERYPPKRQVRHDPAARLGRARPTPSSRRGACRSAPPEGTTRLLVRERYAYTNGGRRCWSSRLRRSDGATGSSLSRSPAAP